MRACKNKIIKTSILSNSKDILRQELENIVYIKKHFKNIFCNCVIF